MLRMKDFRVTVPGRQDELLGYEGEHLARRFAVAVDDPGGWDYRLELRAPGGAADILALEEEDGVLCADLERSALRRAGRLEAQIRGISGERVKRSNVFPLVVGDSLNAEQALPEVQPSEFLQLEQRLSALKTAAAAAAGDAQAAVQSAENAQAAAHTAQAAAESAAASARSAADDAGDAVNAAAVQSQLAAEEAQAAKAARKDAAQAAFDAEFWAQRAEQAGTVRRLSLTLPVGQWDALTQSVDAPGVLPDETAQLIRIVPALASQAAYFAAGVLCTGQSEGALAFTCRETPAADLQVFAVLQGVTAWS